MSCACSNSHTRRTPRGGPLPEPADPDRPPPAELTASVLTDDGWATIVVRTPTDIEVVHWPVTMADGGDLAIVDALARLQLAARRYGCALRLRGAEDALLGLIDLVGLRNVLTGPLPSGCECAGEAERLEQLQVEEVVVADDPPA